MSAKTESVYVLMHAYEYGNENELDEIKELGIYSTKEKAEEAIDRYYVLSGFNRYPRSCFQIINRELDKDSAWTEGFMTYEEIEKYQAENSICRGDEYKNSINLDHDID